MRFIDPQQDSARPHTAIPAGAPRPLERSPRSLSARIDGAGRTRDLDTWVVETHTTSLLVLDGPLGQGSVLHEWYADGVGPASLLHGASATKSALAHLVGLAVGDGALSLDDPVTRHVPELAGSGYAACTVEHVLTMTSGIDWVEDHRDPDSPASRLVASFFGESDGDSRTLLVETRPRDEPGTRWEYCTADSQVLDWVRERATGTPYAEAMTALWQRLGCVRDAAVGIDARGVAMAGGALAACAEDWLRIAALQLDGTAYGEQVLPGGWAEASSRPSRPFTAPGRLPSTITTHAGFGGHWWPLTDDGERVTADGSRGQFCFVDRGLETAVVKTSLWPYDDSWVDRQQRDLSYLGLPLVAAATRPTAPPG
ncbi:MAG: beta-lactamase family protein [Marmoricola sp.]|nr:beta-lactamase family protein [Marmoricola sp.]